MTASARRVKLAATRARVVPSIWMATWPRVSPPRSWPTMQFAPHAPTILVAEDSAEQRDLYVEVLTQAGYRVLEAGDGEEAVASVRRERPGLVLMDVTMPGTSGWNAVRALRDDLATRAIPIIVITGLSSPGDRDVSIAAGCDEHLSKPVDPRRLLAEVRKFLPV